MHHFTANHVVTLDGDEATGVADVALSIELADGTWIRGGAVYRDRYVRREGVWRITRREAGSDFYYDPLRPASVRWTPARTRCRRRPNCSQVAGDGRQRGLAVTLVSAARP